MTPEDVEAAVNEALAYEVGCDAVLTVFGASYPVTMAQVRQLGIYVLKERARKYREGRNDLRLP